MLRDFYLLLCFLFAFRFVRGQDQDGSNPYNKLKITLEASWNSIPFQLNLIESVAAYNTSLYIPTLSKLIGFSPRYDSDDEVEGHDEVVKSDYESYHEVMKSLDIDEIAKAFINFNLVNKVYTPRVQVHYDYYRDVVEPDFSSRLRRECSTDSFGNQVLLKETDRHQAWLLYNNKLYCSADEIYALQTDSTSSDEILPFDRVIGDNQEAPLMVLYGNINSDMFKKMFINLFEDAKSGKLRFLWRFIPSDQTEEKEQLSGYGVDLTLKRTDYIVIDDRDVSTKSTTNNRLKHNNFVLTKDLWKFSDVDEIRPVSKKGIDELGLKLTSFIFSNNYSNITKYDLLNLILQDFPKYASYIEALKPNNMGQVKESIDLNENLGLSEDSNGIYINGSPINKLELDIVKLVNKIQEEFNVLRELVELGFTVGQSKKLISKFALLSAVKEAQFRSGNSVMGSNENRFKVYNYQFIPGPSSRKNGVVFLNDIEKDDTYENYSTDRYEAYLGFTAQRLRPGQVPPLRENVHDLIFVLNLANKEQLRVFFTMSKIILDRGIPQQLGLMAITGDDPRDKLLAKRFYFITDTSSSKEALAFLYKYFEAKDVDSVEDLINSIPIPSGYEFNEAFYLDTLRSFSISSASVIFNGVIYELTSPNWQVAMGKQISQDVMLLQNYIKNGIDKDKSLKSLLYEKAKSERNLRVVPSDPSELRYKRITQDLIENSIAFKKIDKCNNISGTFWLIGNFNNINLVNQLVNVLHIIESSPYMLQARIVNTGAKSSFIKQLQSEFKLDMLTSYSLKKVITTLSENFDETSNKELNPDNINVLERNKLPTHHSFLLFNSRYIRLNEPLTIKDLHLLVEFEFSQRLGIINDIISAYPQDFETTSITNFNSVNFDNLDWFDLVSSVVTKSFHTDDTLFVSEVARYDFSSLHMNNSFEITEYDADKEIDMLLIVDPVDEYSQKMVSIINSFKDFPFINIKVLLQPRASPAVDLKIRRFYRGVYPSLHPKFSETGEFESNYKADFNSLPSKELFTADIDSPSRWIVIIKETPAGIDLDNIKLENYDKDLIYGIYELKSILVEGYANDVKVGRPPAGLSLQLTNDNLTTDTNVMSNLGYFQLPAKPGIWDFQIKQGRSSKHYSLLSASENKFAASDAPLSNAKLVITDLKGLVINPRFSKNPGYENKSLFDEENEVESSKLGGWVKSFLKHKEQNVKKQADINIFTVASGHLYERFLAIMTASVRQHTNKSVKFWIIENYLSSHFRKVLPLLANKYNFEYELVTYRWPNWLRFQREKQRTIWGYKLLFLDVLFPQDLKKVIFVDADQVVRADMKELVEMDLQGAPYGFTPMCDSRKEMDGFRFWKQGYWSNVLKDDLKYHISALYVVDLEKFRSVSTGDRLRSHYQRLSSDPNSLANLDQDLPNNMQRQIKIFSLPQEWLWCETWCSDDSLPNAKTIDLCNNPLTKENKLERAKRLIPEWSTYDNEINALAEEASKLQEKENVLAKKIDNYSQPKDTHVYEEYEHDEL